MIDQIILDDPGCRRARFGLRKKNEDIAENDHARLHLHLQRRFKQRHDFPETISCIAAKRSFNERWLEKKGLSKSSKVVGFAKPHICQSFSYPAILTFWTTTYSVQDSILGIVEVSASVAVDRSFFFTFIDVWSLAIRTTTWRMNESGIPGITAARSDKTRTPLKNVDGVRLYFKILHVTEVSG